LIGTQKGYKDIIGVNDGPYKEDDPKTNTYYTFTLKVEGRNEMVMPIMDFKYDDALFTKLLNGETVPKAMDLAARAAGIAISRFGAAPSIPLKEEVLSFSFS